MMSDIVVHFPLLSIITCLVSAVLCSLLNGKKARVIFFSCLGVCLLAGVAVLAYVWQNGTIVYQMGHLTQDETVKYYWFNNVIRFGVPEGVFVTLYPLVMMLSLMGGADALERDISSDKMRFYYVLTSLSLTSLIAMTYADDSFTGYVFLEICTLTSIGLVAVRERGHTTVAAIRYMIFNLVGSGLYLIGIVLLYDLTGYFMMEKIHEVLLVHGITTAAMCALALITIGLGIKSGLFPFYFWMADTYGESTVASAGIISGLVSKGYIVLLMKYLVRVFGFAAGDAPGLTELTHVTDILFWLGVGGMLFGSVAALMEKRINKMLAYSSAAQIGYIYLALGLGGIGFPAALLQILTHAVTKPLLFVSARALADASGGRPQFAHLRGSGRRNTMAGLGFTVGALSMIGFPGLAGFMVKYRYVEMALDTGIPKVRLIVTVAALVISTLLNTMYMIRTVMTVYAPANGEEPKDGRVRPRADFTVATVLFILLNLAVGMLPAVDTLLDRAAALMGNII